MNLQEIIENHYLPEKRTRRRANTVEGYESSFNLYVIPKFGHLEIAEIDREEIQEWVDSFEKPGAAAKAYKCLRQVIRWSIRKWSMLVIDPTVGIELPRRPIYHPQVLTAKESNKRIRGFYGFSLEATTIIEHALGLRPGENYALDWPDIRMTDGRVRIYKTFQQVKGQLIIYATKTPQSERELRLPKWALDRLREIWRSLGRPKGRIIGSLSPSAAASRIKRFAAKMKLPSVTMQNLRHTWATLAREAKVPIETIAMMMGHSDINTPYRYYMQPSKNVIQDAQKCVAGLLLKAG